MDPFEKTWARVRIEAVQPEIDAGRFPIKRTVGEKVAVEADIFTDGHDQLSAILKYRTAADREWNETPMEPMVNDRWRGEFVVGEMGCYLYTIEAWIDRFGSWRQGFAKKVEADQELSVDLAAGALLIEQASGRAAGEDKTKLDAYAASLRASTGGISARALDDELAALMEKYPDRRSVAAYDKQLRVAVDRSKARFGTWYEMFPRSSATEAARHGTFKDCEGRLPYIASMGFDVLYLPPIHPIGHSFRKGKNNVLVAAADDVGSPWAIGNNEGGHKATHPQLGTLADFQRLVAKAKEFGIEIALDIAYQCSPDHPYVQEHPEWFRKRPDNSIQYAENPPKKYQDIYPFDFEAECWRELWRELKSILLFWLDHGVRIFRVDNPHTKPLPFWEWIIGEIKKEHPGVIFLAEAFTRPKVMHGLAKLGFSQSYTYFTWRNTKRELTQYFTELTQTELAEFFRINLWPNTPDILSEYLQFGGRPAFMARLVLAATMGANYGIYGPAFELCANVPREPGGEEYLNSEKYQLCHWDLENPQSLRDFIARVNAIRKQNFALQSDRSLRFYPVDNEEIICYGKQTEDLGNIIVVVVNLDPHHTQSGWVTLPLGELRLEPHDPYQVHDLLTDARYLWHGARNYVELDPRSAPAHIFRVRRRVRAEQDFDYFM